MAVAELSVVFQHIPRAATFTPPSLVTFPPIVTEVPVIFETDEVVMVGKELPNHSGMFEFETRQNWPGVPTGSLVHAVPFQKSISPMLALVGIEG